MGPAGIYIKSNDIIVNDFGQFINVNFFLTGRFLRSTDSYHVTSTRSAGIYKQHDIMTYISRSADFRHWPIYLGQEFCHR